MRSPIASADSTPAPTTTSSSRSAWTSSRRACARSCAATSRAATTCFATATSRSIPPTRTVTRDGAPVDLSPAGVRAARRVAGAPGHGAFQGAARGASLRMGRRSGKQCHRGARPQPAPEARRRRDSHDSRRGLRDRARMTSIRRARCSSGCCWASSAVAVLATLATYVETRREIGELFDLQLKQLAYSTRIDDLLRGRPPAPPSRDGRRTRRACPRSSRRSGTATACSSTGRSPAPDCPSPSPKAIPTSCRTGTRGASIRMSTATTRCRSRMRSTSAARSPRRPRCARSCRWRC